MGGTRHPPGRSSDAQGPGPPAGEGAEVYDVTFENVQAGLRTDFLFRAANQRGGIVLGTGDLSELALGWCTYGVGDQMSHYGVNAGVPKTLMQHLIRWVVSSGQLEAADAKGGVNDVLTAILTQEISPSSSLPSRARRCSPPRTRSAPLRPARLHPFHVLRRGYRPSKIAFLALHAWQDESSGEWPAGYPEADHTAYDLATIKRWERVFFKRFFANQFKRSTPPNGPKVVSGGTMSPRGDWRMPSDASAKAWLDELDGGSPGTESPTVRGTPAPDRRVGSGSTRPSPRHRSSDRNRSTARSSPAPTTPESLVAAVDTDLRERLEQRLTEPEAAPLLPDIEVLEPDPVGAGPGREGQEPQGHPSRLPLPSRDPHLRDMPVCRGRTIGGKQHRRELLRRRGRLLHGPFVLGELTDEGQQCGMSVGSAGRIRVPRPDPSQRSPAPDPAVPRARGLLALAEQTASVRRHSPHDAPDRTTIRRPDSPTDPTTQPAPRPPGRVE